MTTTLRLRRCTAFTLMELMVVLALIAILSAAIVPEMKGSFEDAVLRSSARQVVDVCTLANSRAVSLGQIHRVRLDRRSSQWLLEAQPQRASRAAPFQPVRDLAGSTGKVDPRIRLEVRPGDSSSGPEASAADAADLSATPDTIAFYPDGRADPAEIQLSDRSGATLRLRLNPVTARLRILDRPKQP
ncbi:MAG: GspH/FimT family pseudopilin [Verrucomicrobiae bacterium]|nr:GspH/FimT family pseudopilin [Verrucomicrobiae bacterium]